MRDPYHSEFPDSQGLVCQSLPLPPLRIRVCLHGVESFFLKVEYLHL
jgi:hypothetical protein